MEFASRSLLSWKVHENLLSCSFSQWFLQRIKEPYGNDSVSYSVSLSIFLQLFSELTFWGFYFFSIMIGCLKMTPKCDLKYFLKNFAVFEKLLSANQFARFYYQQYIWKWLINYCHFLSADRHFWEKKTEYSFWLGVLSHAQGPIFVQNHKKSTNMFSGIENAVY